MKKIVITITAHFPDSVSNDDLRSITADAAVQIEEPNDRDGNEIPFPKNVECAYTVTEDVVVVDDDGNLTDAIQAATNTGRFAPTPHVYTYEEAVVIDPYGQGVRFYFADDAGEDDMGYDVLAYCVRHDSKFGFVDGDTIAEAGSHSDAELWADVIVPAIVDGRIEYAVWGIVQNTR